jgi:hypothetical protein
MAIRPYRLNKRQNPSNNFKLIKFRFVNDLRQVPGGPDLLPFGDKYDHENYRHDEDDGAACGEIQII